MRDARAILNQPPAEARGYMVRTRRYKYLFWENFPAQLFDMHADPAEQNDLGPDPASVEIMAEMRERLFRWFRQRKLRLTRTDAQIVATGGEKGTLRRGIHRGYWGPGEE